MRTSTSGARPLTHLAKNNATPIPAQAPKLSEIKLINYDFAKYGSATERKRILEKWDREVYWLPK